MKTCTKCGKTKKLSEFYDDGKQPCKDCKRAINRQWNTDNPEKMKAASKAWVQANPEKVAARKRGWRKANPEKVRASRKAQHEKNKERDNAASKAWYKANTERANAVARQWREENPERQKAARKAWVQANPEKIKLLNQKRRALISGATATLTQEEWDEIWQEFEGLCFWCGIADATTMDHIVPLNPRVFPLKGHHTKTNVVPACTPCNSSKLDYDPLVFLFKLRERYKD